MDDDTEYQPNLTEPSDERKAELRAAYEEGTDASYQGVRIATFGELNWIPAERNWSGAFALPEGMARPNLNGANLASVTLSNADLDGAKLDNANFSLGFRHAECGHRRPSERPCKCSYQHVFALQLLADKRGPVASVGWACQTPVVRRANDPTPFTRRRAHE